MKIGTITYWDTDNNYGQVLQCFALIRFLKSLGHDAFLIRHTMTRHQSLLQKMLWWLSHFSLSRIKAGLTYRRMRKNMASDMNSINRNFAEFKRQYIPCTDQLYSQEELMHMPPKADAYICGSDQIWGEPNPVMMLQFAPDGTHCIAFAASMGGVEFNDHDATTFKNYLKRFSLITLREQSGVEYCQKIGISAARLFPDPTLMLSARVYRQIYHDQQVTTQAKPYLLIYLLGNPSMINVDDVFHYAATHQLDVKYVAAQGGKDDYEKIYPTVPEWLSLIDNADCIVTNSYHGTIFSLIFNTPFLTIPLVGTFARMNKRIDSLLSHFGLTDRIYKDSLEPLGTAVDFEPFIKQRAADAEMVTHVLTETLS